MPRRAPVSSMTRRPWFDCDTRSFPNGAGRRDGTPALRRGPTSGVEPRLAPALAGSRENEPVVKPERPVLPKLDRDRCDAVAGPVGRAGDLADGVLGGVERDRLLESEAAFERPRLLARPGADAAVARAALEIGVRLRFGHACHRPPRPDPPSQALSV